MNRKCQAVGLAISIKVYPGRNLTKLAAKKYLAN